MKDRAFFKIENKKDWHGHRASDGKTAGDYPEVLSELYYRQLLLSNDFSGWSATNAFRWIEGYANYINNQTRRKQGAFGLAKDFKAWEIVLVDFFGSFRSEMNFDHPALIIKVLDNDLLAVVPITSNAQTFEEAKSSPPHLSPLYKRIKPLGNMSKNSTLLLDHLKIISKDRVLKRKFETEERNGQIVEKAKKFTHQSDKIVIQRKIASLYAGGYLHELRKQENIQQRERNDLLTQLEAKETYIVNLQKEKEELDQKYQKLKEELEALRDVKN
nr:type II toxin-antitoxin system PemK/MazF family toxin [Pseudoalteromonas profundi]